MSALKAMSVLPLRLPQPSITPLNLKATLSSLGFGQVMAKIIALLSILWLATAYGKKAAPKLDIKLEPESESPFEIPDWVRSR